MRLIFNGAMIQEYSLALNHHNIKDTERMNSSYKYFVDFKSNPSNKILFYQLSYKPCPLSLKAFFTIPNISHALHTHSPFNNSFLPPIMTSQYPFQCCQIFQPQASQTSALQYSIVLKNQHHGVTCASLERPRIFRNHLLGIVKAIIEQRVDVVPKKRVIEYLTASFNRFMVMSLGIQLHSKMLPHTNR